MYQPKKEELTSAPYSNRVILTTLWKGYRETLLWQRIREDTHLNRQCWLDPIAAILFCAYREEYGVHVGIRELALAHWKLYRLTQNLPEYVYARYFSII